jgi:hypothetical protein
LALAWSGYIRGRMAWTTNSLGGEMVLDFMFWPSSKHRFGWFLEPGYEYSFARGHDRSIGISGGLLIAIPEDVKPSELPVVKPTLLKQQKLGGGELDGY